MNDAKQVDNPRTIIENGPFGALKQKLGSIDESLEDRVYALSLQERSEQNDLLNRMAQLEQRSPSYATAPHGANSFGSPRLVMPIALFLWILLLYRMLP